MNQTITIEELVSILQSAVVSGQVTKTDPVYISDEHCMIDCDASTARPIATVCTCKKNRHLILVRGE